MARGPYSTASEPSRFRIRAMRKTAGLTQPELAEAVDRDTSTISRWERGQMDFSVSDLIRMAEVLGCAPGQLIRDGDGLTEAERALITFLRANPVHRRILLSQLDVLKETVPPVAAE